MYRIIGIIALAGTLAACPNPTEPQLNQLRKTFDGEYKIILQSGPFRGPLEVWYGVERGDMNSDSLVIRDARSLPWSVKKREPVLITGGRKHGVTIRATYTRPTSFISFAQETVYRLELWIDGTLKKTQTMKIGDGDQNAFIILVSAP